MATPNQLTFASRLASSSISDWLRSNGIQKALAELSANVYDADAKRVDITVPDAIDNNAFVEVLDDGVGMTGTELREKFLFIGRNKRAEGQKTAMDRLVIGSKGIGKLAGFGIASRIEVTTWKSKTHSTVTINLQTKIEDYRTLSIKAGHRNSKNQTP